MPPKPYVPKQRTPGGRHYAESGQVVKGVRKAWNGTCSCVVGNGPHAGDVCGRNTEPGSNYCKFHSGNRSCKYPTVDSYVTARAELEARRPAWEEHKRNIFRLAPNARRDREEESDEDDSFGYQLAFTGMKEPLIASGSRSGPRTPIKLIKSAKTRKPRVCKNKCGGISKNTGKPCEMCPSEGQRFCYHHGGRK